MTYYISLYLENPLYETGYKQITLYKYDYAHPASYSEIIRFLLHDRTDFLKYIDWEFICNDFNAIAHNNAQYLGYKCSYCMLDDLDNECGHTCLAWDTTDYGRIYTDSTGVYDPNFSYESYDKLITNVGVGKVPGLIDIESGAECSYGFIIGSIELL